MKDIFFVYPIYKIFNYFMNVCNGYIFVLISISQVWFKNKEETNLTNIFQLVLLWDVEFFIYKLVCVRMYIKQDFALFTHINSQNYIKPIKNMRYDTYLLLAIEIVF